VLDELSTLNERLHVMWEFHMNMQGKLGAIVDLVNWLIVAHLNTPRYQVVKRESRFADPTALDNYLRQLAVERSQQSS
jgi:hypothetical protein